MLTRRAAIAGGSMLVLLGCSGERRSADVFRTQLNWLHDPSFAAHYRLASTSPTYLNVEGGPGVSPLQRVSSGVSNAAICGFDIFAKFLAEGRGGDRRNLRGIFCDFQRNAVGWVVHPRVASRLGIQTEAYNAGDVGARAALVEAVRAGDLRVGDKVGTETTAILRAWLQRTGLQQSARVVPVGFDSSLVEQGPPLLFPVYLNEEPYRLEEKIGSPLLKIDPVVDGVVLLGNIVVAREGHSQIAQFRSDLAEAWRWVRGNIPDATALVSRYYRSVSPATLRRQIEKTVEFAFYGGREIGAFDVARGGSVERSLALLAEARAIPNSLSLQQIAPFLT